MAYDRYDTRGRSRDEQLRWSSDRDRFSDRDRYRERGRDDDRGFFERASDEVASWFGDDDAERRRERDRRMEERGLERGASHHDRGDHWRERSWGRGDHEREHRRDRDLGGERGIFGGRGGYRGTSGESSGVGGSWNMGREDAAYGGGDYRPMTGDYARTQPRLDSGVEGDTDRSSHMDPHYHSWRRRQMDEFDRDYDDYRRENQARFDQDFTDWRGRRQQKRGLLDQVREHMEVVGNDDEHIGTVDRTAGDRIILTKSDPESGGARHSLSCSDIDRVESDRIILECSAEQARERWRDESRSRALFERDDQGEMGPRVLDRSFEGTYR